MEINESHPLFAAYLDAIQKGSRQDAFAAISKAVEAIKQEQVSPDRDYRLQRFQLYKVSSLAEVGRKVEAKDLLLSLINHSDSVSLVTGVEFALGALDDPRLAIELLEEAAKALLQDRLAMEEEGDYEEILQTISWYQAEAMDRLELSDSHFERFWEGLEAVEELSIQRTTLSLMEKWSQGKRFTSQIRLFAKRLLSALDSESPDAETIRSIATAS